MAWKTDAPMVSLTDDSTNFRNEELWEKEDLGGVTTENNPVPVLVVILVFITIITAFLVTMPLWGQRPTAALYAPYVHSMDKPEVLAAKDDVEAMKIIVAMNKGTSNDGLLERHPVTMDDLRMIRDQVTALEAKGVDMRDYSVVGDRVVIANFEGNFRPDGTRMRQQPWWDKGFTIDVFYLTNFLLWVFIVIKRLPPVTWQPRR
ncbi:MAG: hypothetical protein KGK17_01900 [Betaproteobacteria bacterium]|nr:hypothetical protein [Betaproteobacteria bacterium]